MSKAEKSAEVEDVLSSIRRLVADRTQTKTEPAKPVEVHTAPTELEETTKTDTSSFVEKMNASIAEMTQVSKPAPTEDNAADTENYLKHLDEFLENETREKPEPEAAPEPVVVKLEKPEPFLLQAADMAARQEPPLVAVKDVPAADDMAEASFQAPPEFDTEEIVMPDDIEDDEIALGSISDQPVAGQFIDEDTIREIVSEMVRAELQGDLGDRITRNVRKLVRREIHHALATRELD